MDVTEAVRVLLTHSTGKPQLQRDVQSVYDDLVAGRPVEYERWLAVLGDAAGTGVLTAYSESDPAGHEEMVMALALEIDRQSPNPVRV